MPRVFLCLGIGNLIVLSGAAGIGWMGLAPAPQRHIVLGVFALLLSCFIQVLAFTYLTVTGKMIVQMVHLGRLSPSFISQSKRFKTTFTRSLGALFLTLVLTAATGASSWRSGGGSVAHVLAALAVLAIHLFALFNQYGVIVGNGLLFDAATRDYNAQRRAPVENPNISDLKSEI